LALFTELLNHSEEEADKIELLSKTHLERKVGFGKTGKGVLLYLMDKSVRSTEDTPLHLPPLLDEFRAALQDEIEVAGRNASNNSIPLSNGHKVGQQGSAYQYAFLIDTILNTPDGAPCDFIIPGRTPIKATIVSTEGTRIVISLENDLGQFVPTAHLQTNLTFLMRKLVERIENNASSSNPSASRMLGFTAVTGTPKKPQGETSLYADQMKALESALGRNLTVIWGPPGTGKTHTIGTITEQLYKSARTVLIVSHTNSAVDQAIKHVAKSLEAHLEQGSVIRVGEVRDQELISKYPNVLVMRQIERQSRELFKQHEALVSKRQDLSNELNRVQKKVSILEWLHAAEPEIQSSYNNLEQLNGLQRQLNLDEVKLGQLKLHESDLLSKQQFISRILDLRQLLADKKNKQARLDEQLSNVESGINEAKGCWQQQQSRLKVVERITPLRIERATYPTPEEQKSIIGTLSAKILELDKKIKDLQQHYSVANNIFVQINNTNNLMRILKRLPKPEEQKAVVNELLNGIAGLEAEQNAVHTAYNNTQTKLSRILELDAELSRYEDIRSKSGEQKKQIDVQSLLQHLEDKKVKLDKNLACLYAEIADLEMNERQQAANLDGDANLIQLEISSKLQHVKELQNDISSRRAIINDLHKSVDKILTHRLDQGLEWISVKDRPISVHEKLDLLHDCYQRLSSQYNPSELPSLTESADHLHSGISILTGNIAQIDDSLAKVESNVIKNAAIVGATLTKTYLSDDIQARKFDTVILDEASMAPIPALWVAALLSEHNLIIVGDFKQLPPIVLSTRESTTKWLGRDIFDVSGLKTSWEKDNPPEYFVMLTEQGRFLEEIASIANLFYEGTLKTRPERHKDFDKFLNWYNSDWPYDSPVVLVDTGSLNAWVTSVVKYGNSSRLNFLSATVSVDLAEQLLRPDRPTHAEGDLARILIVSPYSAHMKLVQLLLKEKETVQIQGEVPLNKTHRAEGEVLSGTAHSFQGSEADVVIFDLVADEPHWKVNLFIGEFDDQIMRLLNVALTRAKFRLFVLGDFTYCQSQGKKAFLGKTLIPFLIKSFPHINASDIVPNGLAARAAKAQMTMLGGEIEPNSKRIVVTQADFFRLLATDLISAKKRIIIYSPFITQDRVAFLMTQLQAAATRGISIILITKTLSERSRTEISQIRKIETQLSEIGIAVMHKMHMHEKLVFIDDDITWSGSLNPLSFSNTQEVMERRKSKAVLDDYIQILRLNELLEVQGKAESRCPICGSEMIAAEGRDQPYYWRCVNDDCYSRSIDQSYPFDGVLSCSTCNAPVEFGFWGDYPHWRCSANVRHRQKVFKSHLSLPKMVALIPKGKRRNIFKMFGINYVDRYVVRSEHPVSEKSKQIGLFDDFK
jgi:hypothetical protein